MNVCLGLVGTTLGSRRAAGGSKGQGRIEIWQKVKERKITVLVCHVLRIFCDRTHYIHHQMQNITSCQAQFYECVAETLKIKTEFMRCGNIVISV